MSKSSCKILMLNKKLRRGYYIGLCIMLLHTLCLTNLSNYKRCRFLLCFCMSSEQMSPCLWEWNGRPHCPTIHCWFLDFILFFSLSFLFFWGGGGGGGSRPHCPTIHCWFLDFILFFSFSFLFLGGGSRPHCPTIHVMVIGV